MPTEELKRLIAEKDMAQRAMRSPARSDFNEEPLMAIIDQAAPFINTEKNPRRARPSDVLKVGFYAIASSPLPGAAGRAAGWVEFMLERARKRLKAGLDPNPFVKDSPHGKG